MGEFFNVANEQVNELLKQGLKISNKEVAQAYFVSNNFYDIMNNYGIFLLDKHPQFNKNATFDELVNIHIFDKEIRHIIYKAITETEAGFKGLCCYTFTRMHREKDAFIRLESYNEQSCLQAAEAVTELVSMMKKPQDKTALYEGANLLNNLSFAQTIRFFSCMKEDDQKQLLKYYSDNLSRHLQNNVNLQQKQLLSYLNHLQVLKQYIINGKALLHYQAQDNLAYCKRLHAFYNIEADKKRIDIYQSFIIMRCFLSENQFALVNNSLRKRFKQLFKQIGSIDANDITDSLGFPKNWHTVPCLPQ